MHSHNIGLQDAACCLELCSPLFSCRARYLPLLVLGKSEVYPVTVGLAYWNSLAGQLSTHQILYPLIITGSVVGTLPVMILFLFLQRYWQNGLALGSIK